MLIIQRYIFNLEIWSYSTKYRWLELAKKRLKAQFQSSLIFEAYSKCWNYFNNAQTYFVGWLNTTGGASFAIVFNWRPIIAQCNAHITSLDWVIQKNPSQEMSDSLCHFSNVFGTVEEDSCNPKGPKHIESGTFDVIDNWSGWDWSFLPAWW